MPLTKQLPKFCLLCLFLFSLCPLTANAKQLPLPTGETILEEALAQLIQYTSIIRLHKQVYFQCITTYPAIEKAYSAVYSGKMYQAFEKDIKMFIGDPEQDWKQNKSDITHASCIKFMTGTKLLITPFDEGKQLANIVETARKLALMSTKQQEQFFGSLMP
ncbi:MAG: hypothetical protein MJK04_14655 [Psychrosphaera sp.]|nr:hypothetical protein [Psychrosphaera sp.]